MKYNNLNSLIIFSSLLSAAVIADDQVAYPDDYRNWRHIKSMVIQPGHSLENPFAGIHHIYANQAATGGLASGQFKDGATLVFDLLKANAADHAITEGDRKLVGVMVRDQKRFRATGGWGFEGFAGNSKSKRLVKDGGQSCFACHTSEEKNQYVFTRSRP